VAVALLPFDSPSALWNAFPHPGPYPDDGPATIPALVKQWYGHDLLCPVDLDGNLTRPVLEACSIPHIKMIANSLGAPKRLTREKMIKFILEHHETAAVGRVEAARTRPMAARKRKREDTPALSPHELRKLKRDTEDLVHDLFATGEEPEFHSLYRSSYGLQDRFNAAIYACFKFQNASGPFQMLAYLAIITYCIDARSMWAEFSHPNDDLISRPVHTSSFILALATQIVRSCLNIPLQGTEKIVIDDENLLAIQHEEDVVELADQTV
jgi:hypothetical protein